MGYEEGTQILAVHEWEPETIQKQFERAVDTDDTPVYCYDSETDKLLIFIEI